MEFSYEFSYGHKTFYVTDQQKAEGCFDFIKFLQKNEITSNNPHEEVYYSTDKKITLKTYFLNTDKFSDLLDLYADMGMFPSVQYYLFKVLNMYIQEKGNGNYKDNYRFKIFMRTYEKLK